MSFADTLKGLIGKGKKAAADNSEQIQGAIDKAADFADDKTGGKYSEKIDKAADAAKKAVPPKE
ncbi:antitoxin [Rhodococcus triatomae]|uniref:MT0933-like antitoxin protein n=1 Tax=Rhodococcus triatomae TaxID=300028 RepID=A0A1G8AM51_9NOCA|nr:antitoxin [Rhodococcus triatomae]QNG17724.1 antitoxin [Rhodococcus triatomae]QNG22609.1 antitoxin [Rhodococcus triatomae]SDH22105.1 MT0933-like antitoxin protein [Rhodococcus triatomae]